MPDARSSGYVWTEAESAKKKFRIKKYPVLTDNKQSGGSCSVNC